MSRGPRLWLALLGALAGSLGAQRQTVRALAGQVVGRDGEPVADATVVLRWRSHPELPGTIGHSLPDATELSTSSDDSGRFRFAPPHRGPFALIAYADGGELSSARAFPVMHGAFRRLVLEESFFMAGRVVTADGAPAAGARVHLAPTALQWERTGIYNEPIRSAEAFADARGRFRLHYAHGYLRAPRWSILTAPLAVGDGCSSSAALDPLRPVQSARELTLTLGQGPALHGAVLGPDGEPLAGVELFDPAIPGATATSGADGRFAAAACSGSMWLRADGFAPVRVHGGYGRRQDARLANGHTLRATVLGPDGAPAANARVLWVVPQQIDASPEWLGTTDDQGRVEARGVPTGPLLGFVELDGRFRRCFAEPVVRDVERELRVARGDVVHGHVVSRTRLPLAGVRVVLWPRVDEVSIPPYVTWTDHGGRYAFDPVHGPHALAVDAGAHGGTHVLLAPDDLAGPHELRMPDTPGVRGQVLDADGAPAAGAWVTVNRTVQGEHTYAPAPRREMQAFCMLADDEGRFAFTGLPAGASWSVVGAILRDDVKYNARATVQTGGEVSLQVEVEQR